MGPAKKSIREVKGKKHADCPFSVTTVGRLGDDDNGERENSKKRKRGDSSKLESPSIQKSPFLPKGQFKTCKTLDTTYFVRPAKKWYDMSRYSSFILNSEKYHVDDFIHVSNAKSTQKPKVEDEDLQPSNCWVAKILEIRAVDEIHVYARVYWMYFPDELPVNTHDNGKLVSGRQPYHGQNELIASNHMDIINVISVSGRAVVEQRMKSVDNCQSSDTLYWRQALDLGTLQLSSIDFTCETDGAQISGTSQIIPQNSQEQVGTLPVMDSLKREEGVVQVGQREDRDSVPAQQMNGDKTSIDMTAPKDEAGGEAETIVESPAPVQAESNIFLTFKSQHQLLVHLQHILESACYSFCERTMPDILKQREWDCPEAVELNRWTSELLSRRDDLSDVAGLTKPLEDVLRSIDSIRHNAVHRRPVSTKVMEESLIDAEALVTLLGDAKRMTEIATLKINIQTILRELERNLQILNAMLPGLLQGIAARSSQRQEMEDVVHAEMKRQDQSHRIMASKVVEAAVATAQQKLRGCSS